MDASTKKHLAKTVTWRIVATVTTLILTWIVTGQMDLGLQVASMEFFLKMALYYLHERAWYRAGLFFSRKNQAS